MFENFSGKRAIIILSVAIGVLVLAWLAYLAFGRPAPSPVNQPPGNVNLPGVGPGGNFSVNQPGGLNLPGGGNVNTGPGADTNEGTVGTVPETGAPISAVANGGATNAPTLTDSRANAPFTGADGKVRFYNPDDCRFYEVSAGGERAQLGSAQYCEVKGLTWAPGADKAVLEFPDGSNVVYDFKRGKQYTLPKEMTEFSFSPDANQLAGKFMGATSSDNWVVTVNSDGSALTGVEPMGDNADKVDVQWSANNQVVALSRTGIPSGLFEQQVLLIGFHGENFKSLQVEGRGFEPHWTPDGNRLLYSVYSDATDYRPTLYLVDAATDSVGLNKQPLNLATWADRCTFGATSAYCAVPGNLPAGAGFSRDLAQGLPDTVWQVDLATGNLNLLGQPVNDQGKGITAGQLTVSPDGRYLYFTDSTTGKLRSMQLR